MKIVAFNGSPNKAGNTFHAIQLVCNELTREGIGIEIVHVGNKRLSGCIGCLHCRKNSTGKCVIQTDEVNAWIEKLKEADGIIIGSPVYYSAIAGTMKNFLDRAFLAAGDTLRHKVGASVIAVRRSGGIPTFNQLNNYLMYCEMFIPTSNYWNVIHGAAQGEVLQDEEGVQIMQTLGRNMAYLLKVLNKSDILPPAPAEKKYTNFIR